MPGFRIQRLDEGSGGVLRHGGRGGGNGLGGRFVSIAVGDEAPRVREILAAIPAVGGRGGGVGGGAGIHRGAEVVGRPDRRHPAEESKRGE